MREIDLNFFSDQKIPEDRIICRQILYFLTKHKLVQGFFFWNIVGEDQININIMML